MASAKILVASSKVTLGETLADQIVESCRETLSSRDVFVLALSGGSIPSLLGAVECQFSVKGIEPRWGSWHVILADERCVPSTSPDSNFGSIKANFTSNVPIPPGQVYGIDEFLSKSTSDIATSYEDKVLKPLLARSGGKIDCAVLGFGPDGHTCSLFPNHPLLKETERLVAPIDDSPKPPPSRITLTFPVLNSMSRCIAFCGAGTGKVDVVNAVFESPTRIQLLEKDGDTKCHQLKLRDPAPYPCGMVRPGNLIWIIDLDAAGGLFEL
ncbi:hypothetical protein THAOC_04059 [Thalassiosira oceanica]|uniref:6-phosphogluconolactonase n=1 Tax=Thalassiosira oceanica TaxID=159749 RepID=K0TP92_THAOC|nr:hypothetical protein THAOC_04059 [Thalassiosira oceanica]|eukprot:EJK74272.1 hypothetical protein THAOC_04059 [Thalassiosira oceanica]